MKFNIDQATQVLSATPATLRSLLGHLDEEWTTNSSDAADWQPFDVLGHLIHGDETDWIPRAKIILEQGDNITFEPFDRFAQFDKSKGKSLGDLLDEFERIRRSCIDTLHGWSLTAEQLDLKGIHPELGEVTLSQLLASWVVHDLTHLRQIAASMARRYDSEVGPWNEYLSVLK